jgi:hypothetical protein
MILPNNDKTENRLLAGGFLFKFSKTVIAKVRKK